MQGSDETSQRTPSIDAPLSTVALLTIDVQNSQVLGLAARVRNVGLSATADRYDKTVSHVTDSIRHLQNAARNAGIELIHVRCASYTGEGSDGSRLFRAFGMPEDSAPQDIRFWPPVAPHSGETIVSKVSSGVLNGSDLDYRLRIMGIRVLIVAGLVTSGCVENSIRGLADAGYQIVFAEDACGDWTPQLHAVSRYLMGRWFAATASAKHIIDRLRAAGSGHFTFEDGAPSAGPPAVGDTIDHLAKLWRSSAPKADVEEPLLLLVDMQPLTLMQCDGGRDTPEGSGSRFDHPEIDACLTLLRAFRNAGRAVAHTRILSSVAGERDVPPLMRGHGLWAAAGSAEAQFLPGFEPLPGELVIPRTSFSLFTPWLADQLLRNLGVRRLVVAGIGLETCIASTVRDAGDRGYDVTLATDACLPVEASLAGATFDVLGLWYARLATVATVIEP